MRFTEKHAARISKEILNSPLHDDKDIICAVITENSHFKVNPKMRAKHSIVTDEEKTFTYSAFAM
jgi:hypothetical protein